MYSCIHIRGINEVHCDVALMPTLVHEFFSECYSDSQRVARGAYSNRPTRSPQEERREVFLVVATLPIEHVTGLALKHAQFEA